MMIFFESEFQTIRHQRCNKNNQCDILILNKYDNNLAKTFDKVCIVFDDVNNFDGIYQNI